jgi:hypothetical protein
MTMNSGLTNSAFHRDKMSISELKTQLPKFEILNEAPLTHPGNYIIVWGV